MIGSRTAELRGGFIQFSGDSEKILSGDNELGKSGSGSSDVSESPSPTVGSRQRRKQNGPPSSSMC